MLRFNLARRLRDLEEAEGRNITWKEVSEATGISVSVLSTLASPRPGVVTNTRFVESLCRFLRCQPGDLLELLPPLGEETRCHVDELYPPRPADGTTPAT
ncbi:MAG: helix-turn-helix transcriptional regulator [Gemmataceae bacterium]|nr:helix-turn-helix transcriptional regulator [Gemmataceae bacterium]